MMKDILSQFKSQIAEDLVVILNTWGQLDSNLSKPEYAFNYWILSKLYNIEEECIPDLITEYNDKSIDCYVHFEENKELYIIQNKYYGNNSAVSRADISDFLTTPLSHLKAGIYKKSEELQKIFNKVKDNDEYKIWLHFYVTNDKKSIDIKTNFDEFNNSPNDLKCFVGAEFFDIDKIYELYYGKSYKEDIGFNFNLETINKGTFSSLREEYGVEGMCEAYYIITPIIQIYRMYKESIKRGYPLFEKNIREYLGSNNVNNGIVETLKSKEERKNFIYYNNGITVICKDIKPSKLSESIRIIPLVNPQIVNGCQTANSIFKVLDSVSDSTLKREYKNVYVMVKALIIDDPVDKTNKKFYNNVVKYTNKQNAISEKAFVSNLDQFFRLKSEFEARGFGLLIKQSDKQKYKDTLNKSDVSDMILRANHLLRDLDYVPSNLNDIIIPLEKLLQVFVAFMLGGYYAFVKKNLVLKQDSTIFEQYCTNIQNYLSVDNMIKLYYLYKKSEIERSQSIDKRTPIPYYAIGFLGYHVKEKNAENIKNILDVTFNAVNFSYIYNYLKGLSNTYKNSYVEKGLGDYNIMIKRSIETGILDSSIDAARNFGLKEVIDLLSKN